MFRATTLLGVLLISVAVTQATAAPMDLLKDQLPLPGEPWDDLPLGRSEGLRADTTWYGGYERIGEDYYALSGSVKRDVMWTFDRGNGPFGDPDRIEGGEGWKAVDLTAEPDLYFAVIDTSLDLGEGVVAPVLAGDRSLWVGADKPAADALCWPSPGYGNDWGQGIVSESLAYNGTGDVALSFIYFSDTEVCFDGTQVYLVREDSSEVLLNPYDGGGCIGYEGGFSGVIGSPMAPATYTRVVTSEEIGGAQEIRFLFEFTSDGGWSDEDCQFDSVFGPFGVDGIEIDGGGISESYDFEGGIQGWTPLFRNTIGSYAGIADVSEYVILDPCGCGLSGNILEMHEGVGFDGYHPNDQHEWIESPICDLGNTDPKEIFLEFDMYGNVPGWECLLLRPGWKYYPWTCEVTGEVTWSPRIGDYAWFNLWGDAYCGTIRFNGTGHGLPPEAEKVIAILEIIAPAWGASDPCLPEDTGPTPLFDNLALGTVPAVDAPIVSLGIGGAYQDVGSWPSDLYDHRAAGPANVTMDTNMDSPFEPDVLGDSLTIDGPIPSPSDPSTRWEARMWWRLAKRAPFQMEQRNGIPTDYGIWKERVADGLAIDRPDHPEFTFGWMDSVEIGFVVRRNNFKSEFREDDDDFVGEGLEENEMLWDNIFYPGTRIDYFVTANYVGTPDELTYLPDTSGGNFLEFEILPSLRTANVSDCGGAGFDYCVVQPATLYIDAFNRGAQPFIENSLRTILNGLDPCLEEEGCEIPGDRNWDRYDYTDVASNWNAPFHRGSYPGSNNGMTFNQILGYRSILVNTGSTQGLSLEEHDFDLFEHWLRSPDCDANVNRQVLMMNGDNIGGILESLPEEGEPFMNGVLGAYLYCDAFNGLSNDPDCEPINDSFCVRLLPAGGGLFDPDLDVDAWGNWCPYQYSFDVFRPLANGTGNRSYSAEDGLKDEDFAQVVNQDLSNQANYRTILDGVSWHHMARRNPDAVDPLDYCPRDLPSIVAGAIGEIGAALKWGHDAADYASIPRTVNAWDLTECQGTGPYGSDVADGPLDLRANRLYPSRPNPSGPMTTIRFSLAREERVCILIYDIHGRLVRTLIDDLTGAGIHTATWDGRNDHGHPAGSGIYWCQMRTATFESNKKMTVLR